MESARHGQKCRIVSRGDLYLGGKVEDKRQIIFQLYDCLCKGTYGEETLDVTSREVVWRVNALYEGVWPERDVDRKLYTSGPLKAKGGTFLDDGYYAVWWATQVDSDYMAKAWKGAKYNTNAEPCYSCSCNAPSKPWGDCRRTQAVWLKHCWTSVSSQLAIQTGTDSSGIFRAAA